MKTVITWKGNLPVPLALLVLSISIQCSDKPEPGSEEHIKLATSIVDDQYLSSADSAPENWVS